MIVYEEGPPLVREEEIEVAGRRMAGRAVPYSPDPGPPGFRFDPVTRRFAARLTEGRVLAGPSEPDAWTAPASRPAGGPLLVGPSCAVEEVRGSYRACAEGVRRAGRGAYLLDPNPPALPQPEGGGFVALFVVAQEEGFGPAREAVRRGFPAGVLLPVVPGWTAEPKMLREMVERAVDAGVDSLCALVPAGDGESRRRIIEARADEDPSSEEAFFDRVHHGDWTESLARAVNLLVESAARAGLLPLPPRPVGTLDPRGNAAAAARLEERALHVAADEHRFALLHAAARWIDEAGRDLEPIVREGNFRKIFPFASDVAREAEEALAGGPA